MIGTCSADACERDSVTRGLCNRHYQTWYRENRADRKRDSARRWRERVDYNGQRRKPKEIRQCAEPDCGAYFSTAIPHKRFCSQRCSKRARNRRYRSQERQRTKVAA